MNTHTSICMNICTFKRTSDTEDASMSTVVVLSCRGAACQMQATTPNSLYIVLRCHYIFTSPAATSYSVEFSHFALPSPDPSRAQLHISVAPQQFGLHHANNIFPAPNPRFTF